MIINVFTSQNCMPCRFTKRWLDKHGFEYNELKAEEYADILREQGLSSAPVVSIVFEDGKEEVFNGYRPNYLQELLLS